MQTHNECKYTMYRQSLRVHISHEEPGHMAVCSYAYNYIHKIYVPSGKYYFFVGTNVFFCGLAQACKLLYLLTLLLIVIRTIAAEY